MVGIVDTAALFPQRFQLDSDTLLVSIFIVVLIKERVAYS
jgi:hypothetical protein